MKKTILLWSLLTLGLASRGTTHAQWCVERTFTTTAYYSPLPDQAFYIKGDLAADKYLNGNGTHGASWQPVEPGMLAAPGNYQFGSTLTIPWLGEWVVRDRGGAIVNAGQRNNIHDRIDIRMGHGEAGLIRALIRGKQDITGTYCPGNQYTDPSFDRAGMETFKHFLDMSIIKFNLEKGRKDVFVWKLQEYLIKLGHLHRTTPTGYFWAETEDAICSFQVSQWLVSRDSERCGVYGPLTRSTLNTVLKKQWLYPKNFRQYATVEEIMNDIHIINQKMWITTSSIQPTPTLVAEKITTPTAPTTTITIEQPTQKYSIFDKTFALGDSGYEIIYLQELLTEQWLYESDITGTFDITTQEAYDALRDIYPEDPIETVIAHLWQDTVASR